MVGQKKSRQFAATTVTQSRVSIYAPSRRPQGRRTIKIENSWGSAEVTGDLTQIHQDIVDFLVGYPHFKRRLNDDGTLDVLFSPKTLLRLLGHEVTGSSDVQWLTSEGGMLDDLRVASFSLFRRDGRLNLQVTSGIITEYTRVSNADGECTGMSVRFSRAYMYFWQRDTPCHTEHFTEQIAKINSGAVQAIVRFCLTHEGGFSDAVGDVLTTLNITTRDRRKRARSDLRRYADMLAEQFSILLDGDMLCYTRRPEVWFGDRKSLRQSA